MSAPCCGCGKTLDVAAMHARQRRVLWWVLAINAGSFALMLAGALHSGAASLLSGSLDNLGDALTYALSLAVVGASMAAKARVALLKAGLILLAALAVAAEIGWKLAHPQVPVIYKYHARDRGKHFPADVKNKALSVAAQEGSLSCIPLLIAMGADTEALTPDRHPAPVPRTPLHYATTSQHLTAIELLLDHGADIEAKCCVGFTALRYAFQRMIQPCIQLLLEKGADLSVVDLSVMDLSWGIMLNKETLVRFLLQLGVDPLCPSIFSRSTGCLIAMFNSISIMKLLLEKGASPTIAILDEGATFKEITFEATTLLHQAALYGIAEAIPLLVSHGAEISTRDGNGFQPLHIAAGAGTEIKLKMPQFQALVSETLRFRPRREVVQALLEGGANISATDRQGRTALDHARRLGDEGILKLLMPDQAGMLGEAGGG